MHSVFASSSLVDKPLRRALSDGAPSTCFRHTDARFFDHKARCIAHRRLTVARANTELNMTHLQRVLRYPDGRVRTIRYPVPSGSPISSVGVEGMGAQPWPQPQPTSPPSPEGDWHICSELDESCSFDPGFTDQVDLPGAAPVEEIWGAKPGAARTESQESPAPSVHPAKKGPIEEFGALPSSPAALLKYLKSDKFAAERRKLQDKVEGSYEILHGCPWLSPRPLYCISVDKEGQEHPSTYTLPVAADQAGEAGEMAKILKTPHLEKSLQLRRMQDGLIAFDCDMAAHSFLDALQAAGSIRATLNEVSSHELFRGAADAKAAVVLVCAGDSSSRVEEVEGQESFPVWPASLVAHSRSAQFVPTPAQLAASLRGNGSMADW